jgi:hypothetical protein
MVMKEHWNGRDSGSWFETWGGTRREGYVDIRFEGFGGF